ncbi:MAG: hypothetical protein WB987_10825 [Candidatus Acidiferrales bacterium]
MNRYAQFVGKRVDVQYRVANIHQRSVGTLVGDTGQSIIIEEHFSQGGRKKTMRVEIPYEYVIRLIDAPQDSAAPVPGPTTNRKTRR